MTEERKAIRRNLRKRAIDERDADETTINRRKKETETEEPAADEGIKKLDILYSATGTTETTNTAISVSSTIIEPSEKSCSIESTEGLYHGKSGYRTFIPIKDTIKANAGSQKNRVAGPVRSVANIRTTCRFDYARDLCKDYNETGFCGFGDSCKFLHDRTEYKSGWELEQEWEEARRAAAQSEQDNKKMDSTSEMVVGPGEKCFICTLAYKRPILVTKCGHYSCERCALQHSKKSPKCFQCSTLVNGQFKIYKEP